MGLCGTDGFPELPRRINPPHHTHNHRIENRKKGSCLLNWVLYHQTYYQPPLYSGKLIGGACGVCGVLVTYIFKYLSAFALSVPARALYVLMLQLLQFSLSLCQNVILQLPTIAITQYSQYQCYWTRTCVAERFPCCASQHICHETDKYKYKYKWMKTKDQSNHKIQFSQYMTLPKLLHVLLSSIHF